MKTIKIILIVTFSNIFARIYGQEVKYNQLDSLTVRFVEKLQQKNIDTICIYLDYCIGTIHIKNNDDSCAYSNSIFIPTYILWRFNGKTFLHKKDNCYNYKTIEIEAQTIWNIVFKYQSEIQKEKEKVFEYKQESKKKSFVKITSSPCIREFSIFIGNKKNEMRFYQSDLKEEWDMDKNINYSHNQNLKGLILVNHLEELIKGIETDSLLIRDGWVR